MKKAFRYFNKARKVNCIAAINSLGTVFKEGNIPFIQKDLKKLKSYLNLQQIKTTYML